MITIIKIATLTLTLCLISTTKSNAAPKKNINLVKSPYSYQLISVEETNKLKAIRDRYGKITGLEKKYQNYEHANGLPYHLYVPKHLEKNKAYPLVIFLHGNTDLSIDTHNGFPKGVWSLPEIQKEHPHILFIPRHRVQSNKWIDKGYHNMVIEALADLQTQFNTNASMPNIDKNRIYLTGFSKGGKGTWYFIKNNPQTFAAAVPLSGYFEGPQTIKDAKRLKHIPIWIFNGDSDAGINGSRLSYQILKMANADEVKYHEYENQGHVIDDFAYFTNGFFDWLFAQQLKPSSKDKKPKSK